jgi:hypothetical protein
METKKNNTLTKKILLSALATVAVFLFTSCSRKISFLTSPVVPAARGMVKVKKDKNNNYRLEISIFDLAEVNRLQPAKQTYVVWMISDSGVTINLGQIKSAAGTFTQALKASFETVSAARPVKIFITAEDDASVQVSGTQLVLSTDRF